MDELTKQQVEQYRAKTFKLASGRRVKNRKEAIEFVHQRGFTFFWPIKDITLPSLWTAVAGDRPVADQHDDPGHITWRWKDSLLGSDQWYYAKVLRKRATMIAPEIAPFFYALSENYGSPEHDYLTLYEQGRMTQEAKTVYETILESGPLNTVALRRAAHLTSRESNSRFNRALNDLQADFKLVPVGVAEAGAWNYAFIYDIVARHYPDLSEQARFIGERQARVKLCELYFRSVGVAQIRDLTMLFHWRSAQAERAVESLCEGNILRRGLELEGQKGEWIALEELL